MKYFVRRFVLLLAIQAAVILILYLMLLDTRVQSARAAVFDWLGQKNMYPCAFRKLPMVFEHGDNHYYVIWETTCSSDMPIFEWWTDATNDAGVSRHTIEPRYRKIDGNHHRFSVIFGPVVDSPRVHYKINSFSLPTQGYTINRPNRNETTQVLVISDNQNGPSNFRAVLSSAQKTFISRRRPPNAIIHVGDAVQSAGKLSEWQTHLFSPMEDVGGYQHNTTLVYVPGNHDHDKKRGTGNKNYYMDMYHGIYNTEGLGSDKAVDASYHQFYHSVSLGGTRIIVLDSECPSKEQSEYLVRELQSESFQSARFRIVAIHIPPFIEFWNPYAWEHKNEKHWGEHVRLEYDPLFRKYGVDLVISGHQHNYQRSTIHRNGSPTDNDTIAYAIVGGAGGDIDYDRVEDWKMYNVTYTDFHYVLLDISDRELQWSVYNTSGGVIDQFTIQR
ncbi:hypothetical protein EV175_001654 [Coemansia sp. RSA 1933]|nr:hypothetical protein EV175_001654 [Coemansia sp. RSA 1933]